MDRGGEFKGQKVQDYFNSINVEHWYAHNDEMKSNYTEYIIHTLKNFHMGIYESFKKLQIYRCVARFS